MATISETTGVRVHRDTKLYLGGMQKRINAARKRDKLPPLNQMQVLEIAIRNLTVEMGVKS